MVGEALEAADELAAEGIEIEVIDPRTVQPLDTETMFASVRRTNRVVVVHEAVTFGGLGAEIAAQIQEPAFDYLDAPVRRIGAPFSPVPFSRCWRRRTFPTPPQWPTPCGPRSAPGTDVPVATVGIIANPNAGKDVRRLVAHATVTSDASEGRPSSGASPSGRSRPAPTRSW